MYPVRLPLRGVHSACVTHPLAVAISQLGVASPSPLTTKTFGSICLSAGEALLHSPRPPPDSGGARGVATERRSVQVTVTRLKDES